MINIIILTALLNVFEIKAILPSSEKIEMRRKRGKQNKGRRRGGNGLR